MQSNINITKAFYAYLYFGVCSSLGWNLVLLFDQWSVSSSPNTSLSARFPDLNEGEAATPTWLWDRKKHSLSFLAFQPTMMGLQSVHPSLSQEWWS